MASDAARSPEGATTARAVLADLVVALGDHAFDIVVIGGLAAPRLGGPAADPHEGTTDVDIVVEVAMEYDLDDHPGVEKESFSTCSATDIRARSRELSWTSRGRPSPR